MPTKKNPNTETSGRTRARIEDLGSGTADVVRRATEVLETELSAGLAAARKAEKRFRAERRVETQDLEEAISRFRADGHELVNVARGLTEELRSDATADLAKRLFDDADQALDLALSLVELAPDLLNRAVRATGLDEGGERSGARAGKAEEGAPPRKKAQPGGGRKPK